MGDLFPEIDKCCGIVPIRVSLIFIAILSIMTGVLAQSVIVIRTAKLQDQVIMGYKGVTDTLKKIDSPKAFFKVMPDLDFLSISIMAMLYIFLGLLLLVANLMDSSEVVALFVWGIMFNVVLGVLFFLQITFKCFVFMHSTCLLQNTDNFTSGLVMAVMLVSQFMWVYFAAVANAYVEDD